MSIFSVDDGFELRSWVMEVSKAAASAVRSLERELKPHDGSRLRRTGHRLAPAVVVLHVIIGLAPAESTSKMTGTVVDPSDQPVPNAAILVRNAATRVQWSATTNAEGIYDVSAVPVGAYSLQVRSPGFRIHTVEGIITEVARTVVVDVRLELGDFSTEITVHATAPLIDSAATSIGHVIDRRTVQETPLNGRYFLDLALLAPGSVTPAQNGFSTTPSRGLGALAINTGGNREETVNYMINGITLDNLVSSAISFQPSISTIEEFKIDNTRFSAEYGLSSGAIVNVATRSGGNDIHMELFEFLRNDALDARNFFAFNSSEPPPYKRHQFGGTLGGPIVRNRTFLFVSYEALRQRQDLDVNSVVLSDAQRASVTDPVIARLTALLPRANFTDSSGTPRFVGSAPGPVDLYQWAVDVNHVLRTNDRLHGYFSLHDTEFRDPLSRGNTVPNFGGHLDARRQFFSINEIHTFGWNAVNDARLGFNRLSSSTHAHAAYNPVDFGIRDGVNQPIGLPQISVAGGNLNFGGPSNMPLARGDTTFVAADTFSMLHGRHSLKFGGEFRQFLSNSRRLSPGTFNFPTIASFLSDMGNAFTTTIGAQSSSIKQGALSLFAQTNYKWRPNVTLEVGLRYDWNITPVERYGRFIVFDPASGALENLGQEDRGIYHQNNKNFQPRLGFSWDPFRNGRTSIRGGYAVIVDQPMTSVVASTSANPPLSVPLSYAGTIRLDNAIDLATASGLAPATVDHGFTNAYMQSWNLSAQRELPHGILAMAGYFGSKGSNLILRRNINQPIDDARPYPVVSQSSAILPGAPLGNITQAEGTGNSNYNALWVSASRRFGQGVEINAYYTFSKSLDYNSLSTQGIVVQNSYNLRGDRGLSDFDARHRLVFSGFYQLPFRGHRAGRGWQISAFVQLQSGNPVNIVTTNSTVTGVPNTLRPDATGPIQIFGSVERWFDTSAFVPAPRFGKLGRNVIIGPGFRNTDFSVMKTTAVRERIHLQFRAEIFDLLNHANFGQPGNVVGSPGFGRITNTRFPTGESGSSRQIQFGIKLMI